MKFYGIELKGRFIHQKVSTLPTFDAARDEGRVVYSEEDDRFYFGDSDGWKNLLLTAATGGGNDAIFLENGQVVTTDYTLEASKNAMTTGPIEVENGVEITIEEGARWVVL